MKMRLIFLILFCLLIQIPISYGVMSVEQAVKTLSEDREIVQLLKETETKEEQKDQDRLSHLQVLVSKKLVQSYMAESKTLQEQIDRLAQAFSNHDKDIMANVKTWEQSKRSDLVGFLREVKLIKGFLLAGKLAEIVKNVPAGIDVSIFKFHKPPTDMIDLISMFNAVMSAIIDLETRVVAISPAVCDELNKKIVVFDPVGKIYQLPVLYQAYNYGVTNPYGAGNMCGWYSAFFAGQILKSDLTNFDLLKEPLNNRTEFNAFFNKGRDQKWAFNSTKNQNKSNLSDSEIKTVLGKWIVETKDVTKIYLLEVNPTDEVLPVIENWSFGRAIKNGKCIVIISVQTKALVTDEEYNRIVKNHWMVAGFQIYADKSIDMVTADSLGVYRCKDKVIKTIYDWFLREQVDVVKEGTLPSRRSIVEAEEARKEAELKAAQEKADDSAAKLLESLTKLKQQLVNLSQELTKINRV